MKQKKLLQLIMYIQTHISQWGTVKRWFGYMVMWLQANCCPRLAERQAGEGAMSSKGHG